MAQRGKLDLDCGALVGQLKPVVQRVDGSGALGALDLNADIHIVKTTGAATGTLAAGKFDGQKKTIVLRADGGDYVLTPVAVAGGTTLTFADANDAVDLIWINNHTSTTGKWTVVGNNGVVLA
jgi:hypothetical protein